jgi:M6 family metalloprotease-like protein
MSKAVRFSCILISLLLVTSNTYAATKAGAACAKFGSKSISGGKSYKCVKSGKKLVWDKGTAIQSSQSSKSSSANESNSSSASPAANPSSSVSTKSLSPISECKIADQRVRKAQPNNVGFPITKQEIPITGVTKVVFLPIDFSDAPGIGNPSIRTTAIASKMKSWFAHFSKGKFNIEDQHSKTWFHSSLKSASYSNIHPGSTTSNSTAPLANSLAQEWVDASGDAFDFTGVTTIFFEFPESVKGFGDGTQGRNISLKTKQGNIQVMFNIMGDSWFREGFMGVSNKFRADHFWSFYIHEMFHSMGLPQHAPGNGIPLSIGSNQTGTPEGFSGVLDPWELFLLGWLDEPNIFCASKSDLNSVNVSLTPIDVMREGTKTAIIRISDHQALVIASRRAEEWSAELPSNANGISVYEVDTTRDRNDDGVQADASGQDNGNNPAFSKWAFYLLPDGTPGGYSVRRGLGDYIVKKGQKVTFGGVVVTYVDSGQNDIVQITKIN